MNTPLTSRTTISSRNKMAPQEAGGGGGNRDILTSQTQNRIRTNNMKPPSQIARNRALQAPASSVASQRIANLANGFPSSIKDRKPNAIRQQQQQSSPSVTPKGANMRSASPADLQLPQASNNINHHQNNTKTLSSFPAPTTRLAPLTTARIRNQQTTTRAPLVPSTSSRIMAPVSRLASSMAPTNSLNSRSSSVVSSVSSATASKKNLMSTAPTIPVADSRQSSTTSNHTIPETNTIRRGLAKFSNPIECQRQFQTLAMKIRQKEEIVETRDKEIDKLQDQLKNAINIGSGYATAVQYFATKLKLDSDTNLLQEHEQLQCRVSELMVNQKEYESKLESIVSDYKNHLQVEHDLRNNLERELQETRDANCQNIENLKEAHTNELDDLNEKHSVIEKELLSKINALELELATKTKELAELRKEHEFLNNNYNKLEESLTKDKDARVKYLQEKINQLQKDVESLNSVLEMRLERVHTLERDSLLLAEAQNELITQKDTNKALNQQMESLNAALVKKREQYENLIVEHEKIRQELKRERKERRRMTMRTEQLEYVLNESCASESNMVFNSSIRDPADHLV